MARTGKISKRLLMIVLLTTLLLSACQPSEVEIPTERALSVEIMEVSYGDLQVRTTLTGQVHPLEEVRLAPKMPGTVRQVYVSVGDRVQAGETLVTLDQRDLLNSIRQSEAAAGIAEAGVATAEAGLAAVEEQHQQALRELNRIQTLYQQGAATKQQLEQAEMAASDNALNSSQAQVEQARAQLNQAQVTIEVARSSLEDTVIRAPIEGVVTEVNAKLGEGISGPAVTVAQLNPVVVKTTVSEYLINRFEIGQEVSVKIPAAQTEAYQGTVSTIAPAPGTGSLTYPMEMEISNPDGVIKIGMFAEVELTMETRENVITIPSEAVVIREGRTVVFLVEEERAVMREVIVGVDNGQTAEIAYGLNAGDRIIFSGQDFLEDGSLINDVNGKGSDAS
ncbi:efflux RND transporter periplasmic adaptor subunit [Anoxynatronum buryatiense]|uniref:RND family efflux transporter, MFP subunit n=1 Tax=Anoxynatronum buryatiense TaxID=489973 RepID=A0AA45WWY2_9CLOT|nr:efflux RND transporter periplasmic adaptor subunit [Anoxynatronum buryatiense]SMP61420.1 RND family efflux transporter, MFP subunit [Anoxynatronum buryatiense]